VTSATVPVPIDRHTTGDDLQALLTGTLFIALGVAMFKHAGLLTGGTAGLAFLLHYATGVSFGKLFFLINLPFYWIAWRRMGRAFTLKTFIAVALLSMLTEWQPLALSFAALQPLYAAIMSICLFSLAGIPPLVGFYAKLAVLQSLLMSGSTLYTVLAIFAVLMSLIAAYYYIRVVKVMYFDSPLTATSVAAPADVRVVLTVNGALVLFLGILPGGLMTLCTEAIMRMLST